MAHFEVVVDFGDNAVHDTAKHCDSLTELTAYLERIPNMIGFIANNRATVTIKTVITDDHPHLFSQA